MNTCNGTYITLLPRKTVTREPCTGLPMPVQGRRNLENAKWAIEALGKSLRAAVKEYEIPATVTHFLNGRYPYDLVVRPFLPARASARLGLIRSFGPTQKIEAMRCIGQGNSKASGCTLNISQIRPWAWPDGWRSKTPIARPRHG